MAIQREYWISPEEYLEIDRASPEVKYEYAHGYMYPIRGGIVDLTGQMLNLAGGRRIAHVQIAANMYTLLRAHLQGKCCRAYPSDMKVQVAEDLYFYPDVMVTCNPEDWEGRDQEDIIYSPRLIVEVLSPSTEAYDREDKFTDYQACSSIQEYVLVSAQHQRVEVYQRQGDGEKWTYQKFGPGQEVQLASINFAFPMVALYEFTQVPEVRVTLARGKSK